MKFRVNQLLAKTKERTVRPKTIFLSEIYLNTENEDRLEDYLNKMLDDNTVEHPQDTAVFSIIYPEKNGKCKRTIRIYITSGIHFDKTNYIEIDKNIYDEQKTYGKIDFSTYIKFSEDKNLDIITKIKRSSMLFENNLETKYINRNSIHTSTELKELINRAKVYKYENIIKSINETSLYSRRIERVYCVDKLKNFCRYGCLVVDLYSFYVTHKGDVYDYFLDETNYYILDVPKSGRGRDDMLVKYLIENEYIEEYEEESHEEN